MLMLCAKISSKLVIAAPPSELVDSALQVIAEGYGIIWKPPGSDGGDDGGLKVSDLYEMIKLILIRPLCLSQESFPSHEPELLLLAEHGTASTAQVANSKLPDERLPDIGPSSSLAPSQPKQGSSEGEYEALKKRLDALRSRK